MPSRSRCRPLQMIPYDSKNSMLFYSGIDHVSSREDLKRRSDGIEVDSECVKAPPRVGTKPIFQWRSG